MTTILLTLLVIGGRGACSQIMKESAQNQRILEDCKKAKEACQIVNRSSLRMRGRALVRTLNEKKVISHLGIELPSKLRAEPFDKEITVFLVEYGAEPVGKYVRPGESPPSWDWWNTEALRETATVFVVYWPSLEAAGRIAFVAEPPGVLDKNYGEDIQKQIAEWIQSLPREAAR